MVKALAFKGDKKSKKRKHGEHTEAAIAPSADMALEEDDSWVSAEAATDVLGPIILALPTVPPTCVACDAHGKVFPSELENMVEGDLATAEPHDVRQVWIASRAAGSDYSNFKGHHGRYLSCDKFGILSATREAVSAEESFLCLPSETLPGAFDVQTQREKFLAINPDAKTPEIRGDGASASANTTLRIRMQARFKPRLKANKELKAREKVSRKELEEAIGRRLEDDEVRKLKKARREGNYHEAILDVRVKGKHDKYAS